MFHDYSNPSGLVVLAREDFLALHPDDGPESLAIFLPEGRDPRAAREELVGALGGRFALDVLRNREVRAEVLEVFERTFAVTIALQLVSSVVAAIAVVTVA